MGYSVKWVNDNLGITRDMLRYYEKEKLLPSNESRNPTNKYRDYNEDDISRIWTIKLLLGIGFTAKEIYALFYEPDSDYDAAITKKVKEWERKRDEINSNLALTRSTKFIGRIPTISKIGSMKFDDFLEHAKKNWSFYNDPRVAPYMDLADKIVSEPNPQEWDMNDLENLDRIAALLGQFSNEEIKFNITLHGYFRVISDMRDLDYRSDTVQTVVRLLHKNMIDNATVLKLDTKISIQGFVKVTSSLFLCGDVAILSEQSYGIEGCSFIVKALAYYGGINIDDL